MTENLEIDPELIEKVVSDCEIRNLTRDIIRLRKQEQTDDIKRRILFLEQLRMDAGLQVMKLREKR